MVAPPMVKLMNAAIVAPPYDFTIIEGLRSDKTQQTYYTWGRTVVNPNTGPLPGRPFGAINTKRDGVKLRSEHQRKKDGFGHAVDICPFINGKLDWGNKAAFKALAVHIKEIAKKEGIAIEWGGDWKGDLLDLPHYELK